MLRSGDRVTLEYRTKTYHGVVDPASDDTQPASPKPGTLLYKDMETKDGSPIPLKCRDTSLSFPLAVQPESTRTPPKPLAA